MFGENRFSLIARIIALGFVRSVWFIYPRFKER